MLGQSVGSQLVSSSSVSATEDQLEDTDEGASSVPVSDEDRRSKVPYITCKLPGEAVLPDFRPYQLHQRASPSLHTTLMSRLAVNAIRVCRHKVDVRTKLMLSRPSTADVATAFMVLHALRDVVPWVRPDSSASKLSLPPPEWGMVLREEVQLYRLPANQSLRG